MIDPALVGLISAVTALVASIAGPLTTMHIGRLQIRASVLSTNRQKWIDSFREAVATFCSQTAAIVHVRGKVVSGGNIHLADDSVIIDRFEALIFTLARVRLLVDPLDQQQRQMVGMMQDLLETMRSASPNVNIVSHIETWNAQIIQISVEVLRSEWSRVKRLE